MLVLGEYSAESTPSVPSFRWVLLTEPAELSWDNTEDLELDLYRPPCVSTADNDTAVFATDPDGDGAVSDPIPPALFAFITSHLSPLISRSRFRASRSNLSHGFSFSSAAAMNLCAVSQYLVC